MNRESREIIKVAKELVAKTPYDYMSEDERKRAYDQMGKHIPLMEREAQIFIREVRKLFPESKLRMSSGFSHNYAQVYPYIKVDVNPEQSRPLLDILAYYDTDHKYDFGSEISFGIFRGYRMNLRLGGSSTSELFRSQSILPLIPDAIKWLNNKADSELLMRTLGIDPHFRPNAVKPTIEEIKAIVKKETMFWVVEQKGENKLEFSTRGNGDVGSEEPGEEDIRMAKKAGKLLLDKFGSNNLGVKFETVDEWVYLTVIIK